MKRQTTRFVGHYVEMVVAMLAAVLLRRAHHTHQHGTASMRNRETDRFEKVVAP